MTEKKLKVLDLDTPPEITIKPSQVEAHKYGKIDDLFLHELFKSMALGLFIVMHERQNQASLIAC